MSFKQKTLSLSACASQVREYLKSLGRVVNEDLSVAVTQKAYETYVDQDIKAASKAVIERLGNAGYEITSVYGHEVVARSLGLKNKHILSASSKKRKMKALPMEMDVAPFFSEPGTRLLEVRYVSDWDEGTITTKATLDLCTGIVDDIESSDDGANFDYLISEYITTMDGAISGDLEQDEDTGEYKLSDPSDLKRFQDFHLGLKKKTPTKESMSVVLLVVNDEDQALIVNRQIIDTCEPSFKDSDLTTAAENLAKVLKTELQYVRFDVDPDSEKDEDVAWTFQGIGEKLDIVDEEE